MAEFCNFGGPLLAWRLAAADCAGYPPRCPQSARKL